MRVYAFEFPAAYSVLDFTTVRKQEKTPRDNFLQQARGRRQLFSENTTIFFIFSKDETRVRRIIERVRTRTKSQAPRRREKHMKFVINPVLAICLVATLTIASSANAENPLVRRDDRTVFAVGLKDVGASSTSLTIPAVVDEIVANAFDGFDQLEKVYIGDGVKKIESGAFAKCAKLADVYLYESVRSIADDAFPKSATIYGASGSFAEKWAAKNKIAFKRLSTAALTKAFPDAKDETPGALLFSRDRSGVEILCATGRKSLSGALAVPKTIVDAPVVKLGDEAFADSHGLVSITLPEELNSIGAAAFSRCYALKSIALPSGIKTIENETFQGCVNLTSIELPDQLTSIGVRAFYDCAALPSLQLPSGLKEINDAAFGHCYALASLELPAALETLGSRSFASNICLVVAPESSAAAQAAKGGYKYATNVLNVDDVPGVRSIFWRDTNMGVEIDGVETLETFDGKLKGLPETISGRPVVSVGDSAFAENETLKEVELPQSVKTIGAAAFKGCSELVSVQFPASLRSIGKEAFSDCQTLETPSFPDDLEWIGPKAFADCGRFESIRLPYKLSLLGEEAFWSCDNLSSVAFPYNLKIIGARAFAYCDKLDIVDLPGGIASIGPEAFSATIKMKVGPGSVAEKWAKENKVSFETY